MPFVIRHRQNPCQAGQKTVYLQFANREYTHVTSHGN